MKIFKLLFLLILFMESKPTLSKGLDNVAILVPSCDKYSEAWPGFFTLLDRYWPENKDLNIYLIGGKKSYKKDNVINISFTHDKGWSDNVIEALEHIHEDYVFIILEDYFLISPVKNDKLVIAFETMKSEKAASLVIAFNEHATPHPTIKEVGFMNKDQPYRASLQAVIWRKEDLKKIIRSGESPWQFELDGTRRTYEMKAPFLSITDKSIFNYIGAISRGHWSRTAMHYIKKEKLDFQRHMPVENVWFEKYNAFKGWISRNINKPIKKFFGVEEKTLLPGWF